MNEIHGRVNKKKTVMKVGDHTHDRNMVSTGTDKQILVTNETELRNLTW